MIEPVGLLPVDKPEGPTSHDVVSLARRVLGIRRIGHTGTLDPFASGLLLLCVGWATRLAEYVSPLRKRYGGVVRLGSRTDTDDRTGRALTTCKGWDALDAEQVAAVLNGMVGELEQRPPIYSAKKLDGERAYSIARRGGTPQLTARKVTIHRAEVVEFSPPDISFEIECSSGTYIRSIARDLGEALGVGAHLRSLRRLGVGGFAVSEAMQLTEATDASEVLDSLVAPERAVAHLQRADLGADALEPLGHGQQIPCDLQGGDEPVSVFVDGRLVAIATLDDGYLCPKKVLITA